MLWNDATIGLKQKLFTAVVIVKIGKEKSEKTDEID